MNNRIVTIQDFKVGQSAYVLRHKNMGRDQQYVIGEVNITKVGRKYVTINNWGQQFEMHDHYKFALVERSTFGNASYLFPTRQAAEDYVEYCHLIDWLRSILYNLYAMRSGNKAYSLDQLRKVKAILTDKEENCNDE